MHRGRGRRTRQGLLSPPSNDAPAPAAPARPATPTRDVPWGSYLALVAATAFWAGNYVVGAYAVETMSPMSLAALRWALAAPALLAVAHVIERPDWRAVLARWRLLACLGLLGMAGYALFVYEALRHTSSVNASLVNALNPGLIALLAALVARQAMGRRAVLGLVVGLVGVLIVITRGDLDLLRGLRFNSGDLLMLGAITVWSIYTLGARRLRDVPPIASTAAQAVFAAAALAPFALAGHVHWPTTSQGLASLLFIAVLPSFGSYVLWNLALVKVPAAQAGGFLNLITVFTVLISVALGYRLDLAQVIGGGLVLLGVWWVSRPSPTPSPTPAPDRAAPASAREAGRAGPSEQTGDRPAPPPGRTAP